MAQRDPFLGLCDVGTNAWDVLLRELESNGWDLMRILQSGLEIEGPSCPCRGASFSDARYCPSAFDQMDPSAAFGAKDHPPALSEPATGDDGVSFQYPPIDSRFNRHIYSYPSSTAHANNPYNRHTPFLGRDVEESVKLKENITNVSGPVVVDLPFRHWENVAGILNESAFSSSADLSAWTDDLSYLEGIVRMDDIESPSSDTHLHFNQQLIVYKAPVRLCEWTSENGRICGDELTRASLPEHLIMHGIKKMARNHLISCKWLGCRMKRLINRESIVRHIREVHLRLKRSPKRVKGPHP